VSGNSFGAKDNLGDHEIFRLDALQSDYDVARLPYSLKILLENLLRTEDGENVTSEHIEGIAKWVATDEPSQEIAFTPARVLMQDFPRSSTSRRCGTRSTTSAATPPASTRSRPRS
jgi:aconitate hydratase